MEYNIKDPEEMLHEVEKSGEQMASVYKKQYQEESEDEYERAGFKVTLSLNFEAIILKDLKLKVNKLVDRHEFNREQAQVMVFESFLEGFYRTLEEQNEEQSE